MVGHLIDATQSYLAAFARRGGAAPAAVGVAGVAKATNEAARAFRARPRDELLTRLRDDTAKLIREIESLSDTDWTNLVRSDRYLGTPGNIDTCAAILEIDPASLLLPHTAESTHGRSKATNDCSLFA